MGQRVTVEQAVRLTGRSGKTLRAWLAEDPVPLSVNFGYCRGVTNSHSRCTVWSVGHLLA